MYVCCTNAECKLTSRSCKIICAVINAKYALAWNAYIA